MLWVFLDSSVRFSPGFTPNKRLVYLVRLVYEVRSYAIMCITCGRVICAALELWVYFVRICGVFVRNR